MPDVRPLHFLCIDDEPPPFDHFTEIRVTSLRSLRDVQAWLRRREQTPIDVLICNIDMAQRHADLPRDVTWGDRNDIPAYGPTLALAIVPTNSLCCLVLRSSYWPQIVKSGHVLISLATLLACIERRNYTLADAQNWIIAQFGSAVNPSSSARPLSTDLSEDVARGLSALRERIVQACSEGIISIGGIVDAIDVIENWDTGSDFVETDGCPVHIEIIHPTGTDRIGVVSLFTDQLEFSKPTSRRQLERSLAELKAWLARDIGFTFARHDNIYDAVASLLRNDLPDSGIEGWNTLTRLAANKAAETGIDMKCLIRVAIIFAFVRAWYFCYVSKSQRLRNIVKQRNYPGGITNYDFMDWVYWFLNINPLSATPQKPFARLLGNERDGTVKIGHGRFEAPFLDEPTAEITAFDAYSGLKDDRPAGLLAAEKFLCRKFLRDADRFFPAGMVPAERILWDPADLDLGQRRYPSWLI